VDRDDLEWSLQHAELYYYRGRLFARSRMLRRAKRDLEWALILDRNHAAAALELAEVHALERNLDLAIGLWERSLSIDPEQPQIHYRLGMTQLRLEREAEATRHLEMARDGGYGEAAPDLYRTLGYLYKDLRRNQEAVRELLRYLDSGAVRAGSAEENEVRQTILRLGGRY
jgi:tetratricopeptide (TPR) repeat protein